MATHLNYPLVLEVQVTVLARVGIPGRTGLKLIRNLEDSFCVEPYKRWCAHAQ